MRRLGIVFLLLGFAFSAAAGAVYFLATTTRGGNILASLAKSYFLKDLKYSELDLVLTKGIWAKDLVFFWKDGEETVSAQIPEVRLRYDFEIFPLRIRVSEFLFEKPAFEVKLLSKANTSSEKTNYEEILNWLKKTDTVVEILGLKVENARARVEVSGTPSLKTEFTDFNLYGDGDLKKNLFRLNVKSSVGQKTPLKQSVSTNNLETLARGQFELTSRLYFEDMWQIDFNLGSSEFILTDIKSDLFKSQRVELKLGSFFKVTPFAFCKSPEAQDFRIRGTLTTDPIEIMNQGKIAQVISKHQWNFDLSKSQDVKKIADLNLFTQNLAVQDNNLKKNIPLATKWISGFNCQSIESAGQIDVFGKTAAHVNLAAKLSPENQLTDIRTTGTFEITSAIASLLNKVAWKKFGLWKGSWKSEGRQISADLNQIFSLGKSQDAIEIEKVLMKASETGPSQFDIGLTVKAYKMGDYELNGNLELKEKKALLASGALSFLRLPKEIKVTIADPLKFDLRLANLDLPQDVEVKMMVPPITLPEKITWGQQEVALKTSSNHGQIVIEADFEENQVTFWNQKKPIEMQGLKLDAKLSLGAKAKLPQIENLTGTFGGNSIELTARSLEDSGGRITLEAHALGKFDQRWKNFDFGAASGNLGLDLILSQQKNDMVTVDGAATFKGFSFETYPFKIEDANGTIPFSQVVKTDGTLGYVSTMNPFEFSDFENFQPITPKFKPFSIEKIKYYKKVYGPLKSFASIEQNFIQVRNITLEIPGGYLAGDFILDTNPDNRSLGMLTKINDFKMNEMIPEELSKGVKFSSDPMSGRAGLFFSFNKKEVNGRFDITHIGSPQLISMINYMDPEYANDKLSATRTGLSIAYPKMVKGTMQNGYMDLFMALGGLAPAQYEVKSIPIAAMVVSAFDQINSK